MPATILGAQRYLNTLSIDSARQTLSPLRRLRPKSYAISSHVVSTEVRYAIDQCGIRQCSQVGAPRIPHRTSKHKDVWILPPVSWRLVNGSRAKKLRV